MTNSFSEVVQPEPKTAPSFSIDWFSANIPTWELMVPTLPARDKFLEIGSFEGASACWMLEHALADRGHLFCIDTWLGSPEFRTFPKDIVSNAFERFKQNIELVKKPGQSITLLKEYSFMALAELTAKRTHLGSFDLIYVDCGHMAYQTMTDGVMAWPLLKPGGIMVFDDYTWDLHASLPERPKMAIDAFADIFFGQIVVEAIGLQYIVRKKGTA